MPLIPPYSSMTMAKYLRSCFIRLNSWSARMPSGTKKGLSTAFFITDLRDRSSSRK